MIVLMTLRDVKKLSDYDSWLEPYQPQLDMRQRHVQQYKQRIAGDKTPADFALGWYHFGLHRIDSGWVFRDWAPNATKIYLVGDFSDWGDDNRFALTRGSDGEWELQLPVDTLKHGDKYKLHMYWSGGDGFRVPAWATYVVQDDATKQFDAVVWQPNEPYEWSDQGFVVHGTPLIYEAHIGMATTEQKVGTYAEFTKNVLPRIRSAGYNTVQLMAIAEHPYYGSFGYHVSSFFAPSSRFGTPDDLRKLVNTAHDMGIAVIMDIVHSHAVKNEAEGLSRYDGSLNQYFHSGDRGNHDHWDSRVFDYGKPQVAHYLLSNCRYWIDEFHMDGYRFDGVTSMLYTHHGMGVDFDSYDKYFESVDHDALAYLALANEVIHQVKPHALTIAEDMSAMPGLAAPNSEGGMGFDYRLSMGVPDLWIKYAKDVPDESWSMSHLAHELTVHRPEERTISYAESHDQALVGDKTLMFRLADKDMYDHMMVGDESLAIDRAMALHKMIRLLTASLHSGGYLNFMGNEFGHPEWIDFPREGNGWSYAYARRQWDLRDDEKLKYRFLADFDAEIIKLAHVATNDPSYMTINDSDHVLTYVRGDYFYAYNFHPTSSYTDYGVPAPKGIYDVELSSDDSRYGGFERVDKDIAYPVDGGILRLYLPSRTALVLRRR